MTIERRILNQDRSLLLEPEPQVQVVAFLLTDVEDSTVLWEVQTEAMRGAVAQHDRIVLGTVEAAGGRVVKRVGDGIDLAFADVGAAVSAAAGEIQRLLAAADWSGLEPLRRAHDGRRRRGRGAWRGLLRSGDEPRRPDARRCAWRAGTALRGRARCAVGVTRRLAGKGPRRVPVQGHRSLQHVFQLLLDGLPADFPPLRIDRTPPPTPVGAFGRSVRGYELREQVGGGDVGVVYRAYQPRWAATSRSR